VLHAPTPTAEGLSLPARLIATLPLEPDRRRHRPGPVTDRVLAEAVAAYLELVHAVPPGERAALVPGPGFPRSALDGELRDLLVDALAADPWLPGGLAPHRAEWLDLPGAEPVLDLLDEAGLTGVVAGPVPALLRMRRLGPAALVERLFGLEQPPSWWRALYSALADVVDEVPGLREDLRALPVPLVDGRTAAGPPTVLVSSAALPAVPGLHVVHPDAAHPLLLRLGAVEAGPGALLEHPAVLAAVEGSLDDAEAGLDPLPLARAVLGLVAAHGRAPAAALGALALPAADGAPARADELLLPDAALRPLLAPDAALGVLDPAFAASADRDTLVAVGVLDGFALVVDDDPAGPDPDLDDAYTWWDSRPEPPRRVRAVRDLDLIADGAWPAALALLAADRGTRAALLEPGGHTGWWIARHARLDGERPGQRRLPSADALAGLYDPVTIDALAVGTGAVDEAVLAAAGVRAGLSVADAEDAADLLARLADPERHPDVALVAEAHAALTEAVADGRVDPADLDPPEHVRALDGTVVGVDVAVVLDAPWPAAVLPPGELVAGGDPGLLAELLDLPLATEVVGGAVESTGRELAWVDVGEVVVACHTLGVDVPDGTVVVHDELRVAVTRPVSGRVRVPVWPDGRGSWHTDDPLRALVADLAVLDTDV
jgi:hypothetical protein